MNKTTIAHDLDEKERTKDVVLEDNVNFDSLLLPDNILKGLSTNGFRKPSPIQFKSIPLGRCGFDLVVKSKSGTGKTLVFSIIALETVNPAKSDLQVLILVPTREIAVQIKEVINLIGGFIEGLKVESFIGGLPIEDDIKKAKGCHIAVGAPGRVKHLISQGAIPISCVRLLVLDEADKLMETSFQGDINEMFHSLPARKQIIASSATYPQQLDLFLARYMLSPTHITAEVETPVLLGLKQFVSVIKTSPNPVQFMKAKNAALIEILTKIQFTQCLVFSNYQTRAESVSNILNQKGWNSTFISAAQSQIKRLEAVNSLKEFKSRILLSTDLTSRGIDAANVDLVINYDIPHDAVAYLHRMGRAGRYGSSGICINLAIQGTELEQLQNILGAIGSTKLSISKLPDLNDGELDVWNLDPTKVEQIHGTVSSDNKTSDAIKTEILEMKQKREKKKEEKLKKSNKDNKSPKTTCLEKSVSNLSENKKEIVKVPNFSEVEAENLFQSLAYGNDSFKSKNESTTEIEVSNDERETSFESNCDNSKIVSEKSNLTSSNIEEDSDSEEEIVIKENLDLPESCSLLNSVKKMFFRDNAETDAIFSKFTEDEGEDVLRAIDAHFGGTNNLMEGLEACRKRKRHDTRKLFAESNKELPKEKRRVNSKLSTYCKNKALLSVTSLLCSDDTVNSDPIDCVRDYLELLKTDDAATTQLSEISETVDETLKRCSALDEIQSTVNSVENCELAPSSLDGLASSSVGCLALSKTDGLSDCSGESEDYDEDEIRPPSSLEVLASSTIDLTETPEDFFKVAYDYAMGTRKAHWLSHLSERDFDTFMIFQQGGHFPDPEPEVEQINYEKGMEILAKTKLETDAKIEKQEESLSSNEHFEQCYQECSEQLWQRGLTFDCVEDFDNWYYNLWQQQLQSVRNYVQQNIYVEEMNKYQQQRRRPLDDLNM